ncbi:MAG: hypothetical protein JKY30_11665, partial [Flavobacteriales bacterium]|nr:hypothetical protein [Flavobacteriales bacterium]
NNTAVGEQSLTNNLSGQQNTSVGFQTLRSNTNGGNNNAVGYEALRTNTTGFNNVAIGHTSLYANLIGNNNVALGSRSGRNSVGSGNVFIGNDAGFNELGSDKLYIENSTSSTPLIWGDFANDSLKINGTLSVLDGTQGTSGNVLTDDGFGNATWQTPISGGWSLLGNSGTNPASNGIGTSDAQDLVFLTNGAERMRITQTGNVGIGIIPNPIANLHIAAAGQAITAIQASHNGVADQSGMLTFLRSRGTINVPTGILGGDRLGKLEFNGWDGSSWSEAASIKAVADENFTIGTRGTRVEFHTTPIGTNTSSEVMRLLDNGDISLAMTGGDVRVSNAYFMPNVDGVANQVLTTNGAGVTSWQTPAGGSLWNLNGSDINYMTGRVGIGIVTPVSSFNIIYTGIDTEASLVNYTNNSAAGIGTGYFVGANNTGIGSITAAGFTVNTSSNSSETKAIDANNIANGTTNYGIKSVAIGAGLDNYGGDFSASGGSSTNTAIRALAEASGTSQATGIYATAQGATNNTTYGVYGQNASSTTGAAYAGYFQNLNSTGSGTYGVRSNVSSTNTNNQYGFYAGVNSGGGGTKYGLYSSVTGGTTNWAGYFAAGDVYIGAGLVIPTNAGAGKVLTSDATGNATWKTGQIAFEAVPAGVGQNFNSVPQSVDLSVGTFNMGGAYNFSGSEFIAPVSGVYSFQCQITVKGQSASPSLNFTLEMLKNSASFKTSTNEISDTDSETVTINITMSLIAGDKISFQAYHDVIGGFVVATSSIQNTWFSGHLVFEN